MTQDYEMRDYCCQHSLSPSFLDPFPLVLVNLISLLSSVPAWVPIMCHFHGLTNVMGAGVRQQTPQVITTPK